MTASYNQSYGAGTSVFFPSGISGWHLVSQTPNESLTIDNTPKNADGDPITADGSRHVGGKQKQHTEVWAPDGDSSTLSSLTIGDIDDDKAIVSASLQCTNNGRPTLTLTGHVHDTKETESAEHIGDTLVCSFAFPTNAYGAVNPFPGAGDNIAAINDYEITSSTQTFAVNHIDEPGRTGEFLVGASRGATRTGQMSLTTANTVTLGKGSGGWAITSKSQPTTNEGVVKLTVEGSMPIATMAQNDDT